MFARFPRPWPVFLLLGAGLLVQTALRGQDAPPADDALPPVPQGVEVQARGPVHEAFAELTAEPQPTKVVPKEPPKPLDEMPPEEKPDGDVTWIGGYWAWDDDRADYLWVSGVWRTPPPGKEWVAGYWRQEGDGWQWAPGFWTPASKQDAPQDVTYLPQPPEAPKVAPPGAPPAADTFYVPGHWEWKDGNYLWVSGYWARVQPNYVWVAGHFRWTPGGYVYLAGYWDHTVRRRGVLYAPVFIDPNVVVAGYVYTPAYAVPDTVVVDALFVRPCTGHYYFGDYYEPRYHDIGFTSCVVYSRDNYDSIVVYERYEHREDPTWLNVQINLFNDRREGRAPVPPRTLNQQMNVVNNSTTVVNNTTVINNITNNNTTNNNNTNNNVTVNKKVMTTPVLVAPSKAIAASGAKVVKLDPETRQAAHQQAAAVQQAVRQRSKAEVSVAGGAPKQPHVASFTVPKAQPVAPKAAVSQGTAPTHNTITAPGPNTPTTGGPTTQPPIKPVHPSVTPTPTVQAPMTTPTPDKTVGSPAAQPGPTTQTPLKPVHPSVTPTPTPTPMTTPAYTPMTPTHLAPSAPPITSAPPPKPTTSFTSPPPPPPSSSGPPPGPGVTTPGKVTVPGQPQPPAHPTVSPATPPPPGKAPPPKDKDKNQQQQQQQQQPH